MGQLRRAGRGWYARIGGRNRWVCSARYDEQQAVVLYHRKAAAIEGGLPHVAAPAQDGPCVTLGELMNRWLHEQRDRAESGAIKAGHYAQVRRTCKRIDALVGHNSTAVVSPDFLKSLYTQLSAAHGPDLAARMLGHFRGVCRDGAESGWCEPMRLGTKVMRKFLRKPRPRMKWRLYTPVEIRLILTTLREQIRAADGRGRPSKLQLYAMILLALNGGYGAMELGELRRDVVDLRRGVINHARGKTGARHLVPLWRETVAALRAVMRHRRGDELVFRTREGNPWRQSRPVLVNGRLRRVVEVDNVGQRFNELVRPLGLKIKDSSFYRLKHLHCTVADEAGDPHATFVLAGHALPGVRSHYVKISEERLRKVVEYVRHQLLGA